MTDTDRLAALQVAAIWVLQARHRDFDGPSLRDALDVLEIALLEPARFAQDYMESLAIAVLSGEEKTQQEQTQVEPPPPVAHFFDDCPKRAPEDVVVPWKGKYPPNVCEKCFFRLRDPRPWRYVDGGK